MCTCVVHESIFLQPENISPYAFNLQLKALTVNEITVLQSFCNTTNFFCLSFDFHLVLESLRSKGKAKKRSESYVVWVLSLILAKFGEVLKMAVSSFV